MLATTEQANWDSVEPFEGKKNLLLVLPKQRQNFIWAHIIIVTIVICLLMENK